MLWHCCAAHAKLKNKASKHVLSSELPDGSAAVAVR
jgi:hypothetical protein